MTLEQAVKHFGSQAAVARAIGISPEAVSMWVKRGGAIPELAQRRLEDATKGKLKADRKRKA